MNTMRVGLLLAAMTALFMFVGYAIGGGQGMGFAFLAADAPEFYRMVEQLAARAQLPMPKVYIIDTPQPNAFATGRNPENAAVAATTGLLRSLSHEEIAGVMAHELAHVKNRDTLVMTITATIAGAIGMLANFAFLFRGGDNRNNPLGAVGMIVAMILAPLAATLVQLAISRTREYGADKGGAEICGNPMWLASALQKLEQGARRIDNHAAEANPATAHLFIVNPLHAHAADGLFSTHPKTANRVAKLAELAGSGMATAPMAQQPARRRGPWG